MQKKIFERARINAIEALNQSSKVLFFSHDELGALLAGVKSGINAKQTDIPEELKWQTISNLHNLVYDIHEKNRLEGEILAFDTAIFSPDNQLLALQIENNTVTLWNVNEGKEITTFPGFYGSATNSLSDMAFSPDNKMLAAGYHDRTIEFWRLDLDNLLLQGCEWIYEYLKTNPHVSKTDRLLCDDIGPMESGRYYQSQGQLEKVHQ